MRFWESVHCLADFPEWFRQELWTEWGAKSLKEWLYPADGKGIFEGFDAEELLTTTRMWQNGDVETLTTHGDYRKAFETVTERVLVMPLLIDQYFDAHDSEEEVKHLKSGIFTPIQTIWGHTGGGEANEADTKWMDGKIQEFLRGE